MPGSKMRRCLAIVGIFLIFSTLIVGMVGCGSGQYSLTIQYAEGGWVSVPIGVVASGETCNFDYGAVVSIEAGAYICYEFVNWTGDVGTIADVEDGSTTITMNDSYVITANFALKAVESMEIWDWYDLAAIRDNLCWNYTLMNDLDSSTPGYQELAGPMANGGRGWRPIGSSGGELNLPFKGTFDGQGYEIHDLFIDGGAPSPFFELGLFGLSGGVIKNMGVVNATVIGVDASCVGGLVGDNCGTVSNSYSTGNVSGDADYGCVGGLIGQNSGTVSDSYSAASVTGIRNVGGLVGVNFQGTVNNCYSNGNVNGEDCVGGLVAGTIEYTVSNSFWDIETSGQATSNGGTGKSTAEMQNIATFSGAGWDITEVSLNETNPAYVWNIVDGLTYPFLSWQL
jgi:hypothetical protein